MDAEQIRDAFERQGFNLVKHEKMNPNNPHVSENYVLETFYFEFLGSPILYPIQYLRSKRGTEKFRYKALITSEDLELFVENLKEIVIQDIEEWAETMKSYQR